MGVKKNNEKLLQKVLRTIELGRKKMMGDLCPSEDYKCFDLREKESHCEKGTGEKRVSKCVIRQSTGANLGHPGGHGNSFPGGVPKTAADLEL